MPVVDGRAVLMELREREHQVAVLIISAAGSRAVGREFGVPALEKPSDIDVLAQAALGLTAAIR